jgi:hypothetical protein
MLRIKSGLGRAFALANLKTANEGEEGASRLPFQQKTIASFSNPGHSDLEMPRCVSLQ